MAHPEIIPNYEQSLTTLAKDIENLRYDKTLEFLKQLREAFFERHDRDLASGKILLSNLLLEVGRSLDDTCFHLEEAWNICKNKMNLEGKEL